MKKRTVPFLKNALGIGLGATTGLGFVTWNTEEAEAMPEPERASEDEILRAMEVFESDPSSDEHGGVEVGEPELIDIIRLFATQAIEAREQLTPEEDGGALEIYKYILHAANDLKEGLYPKDDGE